MYRLVSEGIVSVLQSADKEASLVVLELIRETAPWDEPKENPHALYHAMFAQAIEPYVRWAVGAYVDLQATQQYKDGLITGKEYLEFLSTMWN